MKNKLIKTLAITAFLLSALLLVSCYDMMHTHEYGPWGENTATCTESGKMQRTCQTCNAVEIKTTNPLGHNVRAFEDSEPTCTEFGYENYVGCTRCNYFKDGKRIDYLGHDLVLLDDVEASCTEPGFSSYSQCSRCEYNEGTKLEPLGHDMSGWFGNTATCAMSGVEHSVCRRIGCTHSVTQPTERLGHTMSGDSCTRCHESDILVLVENGKANFRVIHTADLGSVGKLAADSFVEELRALGITVDDPVRDIEIKGDDACEIIIGANAKLRGDECNVTNKYLGRVGEVIRRVGNKIVIAGSTADITVDLFEKFVEEELGICSTDTAVDYIEVNELYNYENITLFPINTITINSNPLDDYKLVIDVKSVNSGFDTEGIDSFSDNLYKVSGYRLSVTSPISMTSNGKYVIIRYVEDAGEEGFRVYVSGNNLVVECAYQNVFNNAFVEFANNYLLNATGDVSFSDDFTYKKTVSKFYYEDFKAVGDGETCDYEAIYNTHVLANMSGQKVYGKQGAVYYISPMNFTKNIPVKTDVDFCGATFVVNDEGDIAYMCRQRVLFLIDRDIEGYRSLSNTSIKNLCGTEDVAVPKGTTSLEWLVPELKGNSMVQLFSTHRDYIRHGSNQNSGEQRTDILIVDVDGKLADDTYVAYDFDKLSLVRIYRVDDKPITIENGNFQNICCKTIADTKYDIPVENPDGTVSKIPTTHANQYKSYKRGFAIYRSNVTIKNITHEMIDEPEIGSYPEGCGYTPDDMHYTVNKDGSKTIKYGSRHESYPYYGFLFVENVYNLLVQNSQLDGHTVYYEDKPATASTGWQIPTPVPMGSYDFVLENSTNITFKNVVQKSETGLGDERYWGIMASNGSKNLTFENCKINRFDAHRGFWNATLKDTTIGHSINVIGGGTLILDGVTKITGSEFMSLRGDYGATFDGDMIIKNCTFENHPSYNTNKGGSYQEKVNNYAYIINSGFKIKNEGWDTSTAFNGAYWLWDFGYTCYLPHSITFENFTSRANKKTYVFNDLPDIIFEKSYVEGEEPTITTVRYPYQITKSITYINMTPFENCAGTTKAPEGMGTYTYESIKNIPVTEKEELE